ncbi:PLP-dependent aspartate aminotransferase family protein [Pilimelia columellifera]|uniref:PLP-dependent transferase n=1 Tax=Pilimelia columellifera subsp. columellifera TaxID=706583 RepID=A0ABN3N8R1_9ACTN
MSAESAAARPAYRPETAVVASGRPHGSGRPLNVPVVLASNFRAAPRIDPSAVGAAPPDGVTGDGQRREYARDDGTPGWEALEAVVGELEGGHATAFSSGMAAAAAVFDLLPVGARVVAPTDSYIAVRGLLANGQRLGRWSVQLVDVADTAAAAAAAGRADLVWLESPTNPLLQVADLAAICAAAKAAGARAAVDNTFATPLLQRPLDLGADIVIHSATKFLGGHSDLLLGVTVAGDPALAAALRHGREMAGATPGALEAYLALRGIRTLAVRLDWAQRSAHDLARRLAAHPAVTRVRYPGLPDDPGHEVAARQMSGFGAVLAFDLADAATADRVCDRVRIITSATSLGGVESTIERRAKLPGQEHVAPGLLRLSVGCEHLDDLWHDLACALDAAGAG